VSPEEARDVLALLSAGFPRQDWPEPTRRLWLRELEPYGVREATAAAQATWRSHEFLSPAVFHRELAAVRERHLDQARSTVRPDRSLRALPAGDLSPTTSEVAKQRLAELRAAIAGMRVKSRTALGAPARVDDRPITREERLRGAEGADICPWPKPPAKRQRGAADGNHR
jgi:hypothetical protein